MPAFNVNPEIAFFIDGTPVFRYLPLDGHPLGSTLDSAAEIYEEKHLAREKLRGLIKNWVEKLRLRHKTLWDNDKRSEINKEIKRLRRTPDVAVPELSKTYQGCIFLISQWEYLRKFVRSDRFKEGFRVSDKTLFLNLSGVAFHMRDGAFPFENSVNETIEQLRERAGLAITERLKGLETQAEALLAQETIERDLAIETPELFPDKQLRGWKRELQQLERELFAICRYVMTPLEAARKSSPNPVPCEPRKLAPTTTDLSESMGNSGRVPAQHAPKQTNPEPSAANVSAKNHYAGSTGSTTEGLRTPPPTFSESLEKSESPENSVCCAQTTESPHVRSSQTVDIKNPPNAS